MTDALFEDEKPDTRALAIYQAYPLHRARAAALKAIEKALEKVDFDTLMAAVVRWANSAEVAKHFRDGNHGMVKRCATWMHDECWDDEIPETAADKRKRQRDEMDACFERVKRMDRDKVEVAIATLKAQKPHAWGSWNYMDIEYGKGDDDVMRLCVRICQLVNSEPRP